MNQLKLERSFLFVLMAISAILLFFIFRPFLISLILAATFAAIFQPVYDFLVRILRFRGLAAWGTIFITVTLVLVPLIIFSQQISSEAFNLYLSISSGSINLPETFLNLQNKISSLIPELTIDFKSYATQTISFFFSNFGSFFAGTINVFINFIIGLIAYYYLLKDGKHFRDTLIKLSPLPNTYDQIILKRLGATVNSVIKGTVIIALIQGFVAGIGFSIFGVPNPALWASAATISALIPGFGTSLVMIPSIIFLFLSGQNVNAFGLIIWAAFAVGLVDNFLSPKILGRGVKIHPLFIIISILGGIAYFGPFGFLLGPLTLAVFFALFDIYQLTLNPLTNDDNK